MGVMGRKRRNKVQMVKVRAAKAAAKAAKVAAKAQRDGWAAEATADYKASVAKNRARREAAGPKAVAKYARHVERVRIKVTIKRAAERAERIAKRAEIEAWYAAKAKHDQEAATAVQPV